MPLLVYENGFDVVAVFGSGRYVGVINATVTGSKQLGLIWVRIVEPALAERHCAVGFVYPRCISAAVADALSTKPPDGMFGSPLRSPVRIAELNSLRAFRIEGAMLLRHSPSAKKNSLSRCVSEWGITGPPKSYPYIFCLKGLGVVEKKLR